MKKLLAVVLAVAVLSCFLAIPAFSADKLKVMNGSSTVFDVTDTGQVSIGTGDVPMADVDIVAPNNGVILLGSAVTDATMKAARMVVRHYTNAQLPVYLFGAASTATDNYVAFGGGASVGNAATQLDFYTAANPTTPTGTSRITVKKNGNVGVGTTNPQALLDVAGTIRYQSLVQASSREYKNNVEQLSTSAAVTTLEDLNPVTFKYINDPATTHLGFIAEDVPAAVATPDRKAVRTTEIVAVLTKVVQEQNRTIAELSEKLNKLEAQVTRIKSKDMLGNVDSSLISGN